MTIQANTATLAAEARVPFDAAPADAAPTAHTASPRPVFMSRDGRRARVVRAMAAAVAAVMVLWLVALGVCLLGTGLPPRLPRVTLAPGSRTTSASAPDGRATSRVDRGGLRSTAALLPPPPSRAGSEARDRRSGGEGAATQTATAVEHRAQ